MITNADVMNELANAAQAATRMTEQVEGKVGEINSAISDLVSSVNNAIENVNNAIPNAINSELSQTLFLDENNGDDSKDGKNSANAKATLKACIDAINEGATANINVLSESSITVNEDIEVKNKKITLIANSSTTQTLNINAPIRCYYSEIIFYYPLIEVKQSTPVAFYYVGSTVSIRSNKITALDGAESFYKGEIAPKFAKPGSFFSILDLTHAEVTNDNESGFIVFDTNGQLMAVCRYYSLTISGNVELFSDKFYVQQLGTKNVYLLGA